jgi:hypothetical protein
MTLFRPHLTRRQQRLGRGETVGLKNTICAVVAALQQSQDRKEVAPASPDGHNGKRVKKLRMLALLACALPWPGIAMAAWTQVAENDFNSAYVDPVTIKRAGSKARMWALFDNKSLRDIFGYKYLSEKVRYEFDCEEKQARVIADSYFDGYMGDGNLVLYIAKAGEWGPVDPETEGEALIEVACRKP